MNKKKYIPFLFIIIVFQFSHLKAAMQNITCINHTFNDKPIFRIFGGTEDNGTGFFISPNGHLLTNQHVIDAIDMPGTGDLWKPEIGEIITLNYTHKTVNCDDISYCEEGNHTYVENYGDAYVQFKVIALGDPNYTYLDNCECGEPNEFETFEKFTECINTHCNESTHSRDYALLQIINPKDLLELDSFGYLSLSRSANVDIGDTLHWAGVPAICEIDNNDNVMQTDQGYVTDISVFNNTAVIFSAHSQGGASGSPIFKADNVVALLHAASTDNTSRGILISSLIDSIEGYLKPTIPIITIDGKKVTEEDFSNGIVLNDGVEIEAFSKDDHGIKSFQFYYNDLNQMVGGAAIEFDDDDIQTSAEATVIWDIEIKPDVCKESGNLVIAATDDDGNSTDVKIPVIIENSPIITINSEPSTININSPFSITGDLKDSNGVGISNAAISGHLTGYELRDTTDSNGSYTLEFDTVSYPVSEPGTYDIVVLYQSEDDCLTTARKKITAVNPEEGYNLSITSFTTDASSGIAPGDTFSLNANFENKGNEEQNLNVNWYVYPPNSGTPYDSSINNNYGTISPNFFDTESKNFTLSSNAQEGQWSASVFINTDKDEDGSDNYASLRFYVGENIGSATTYNYSNGAQSKDSIPVVQDYHGHDIEVVTVADSTSNCSAQFIIDGSNYLLKPGDIVEKDSGRFLFLFDSCIPEFEQQGADVAYFNVLSYSNNVPFSVSPQKTKVRPGDEVIFNINKNPKNVKVVEQYKDGDTVKNWDWDDRKINDDNYEIYAKLPTNTTPKNYTCFLKFKIYDSNTETYVYYAQKIQFTVVAAEEPHDIAVDKITPSTGQIYISGKNISISSQITAANNYIEFPDATLIINGPDNYSYKDTLFPTISGTQTILFQDWNTTTLKEGDYTLTVNISITEDSNSNNNSKSSTITLSAPENLLPIADNRDTYFGIINDPIIFDASNSFDFDGNIVLYEWDWNNDGRFDDSTSNDTISHTWTAPYSGVVILKITDNNGGTNTDQALVEIVPCSDSDNDTICDEVDNCLLTPNTDQSDSNNNGIGNACEKCIDIDADTVCDDIDNCPNTPNQDQLDSDANGIGDACEISSDIVLTNTSPDTTITQGQSIKVYGTSGSNHISLESGAEAQLLNFPGNNRITFGADSTAFTVSRSGATVIFEGNDGTYLKMPATRTEQTIEFSDSTLVLRIAYDQVMLGWQVIRTTPSAIDLTAEPPEDTFTNKLGMNFILIQPGTFQMGSPTNEPGRETNETQHSVTLTEFFYIQTTEITVGQWQSVMGYNPPFINNCGSDCPVERVSWDQAQEFITTLNALGEGAYSLPTEAQWEYSARAGSTTAFTNGTIINSQNNCLNDANLDTIGWYCGNTGGLPSMTLMEHYSTSQPVARKESNAWGLYDMHGNVWEWCQDWYGNYSITSAIDPEGPSSGSFHVIRGGGWDSSPKYCRSAYRYDNAIGLKFLNTGFRLVLNPIDQ
ncbi:hypothetical protein MTBBW1_2030040 [Desulfamplus magnetovallimortis]|uniref:Sulfatase-modifying factor enzyme-like domain-containing protein n=1 Tax=Desulfamplus magnetovallimortis TaxID=1246637 RepID=A0A1W1HBU3_9BACT|nr:SUMF1/EgtB/PvdO family nonheme iron enzyme [Desulfamplus magnetovallimortis]SLM29950.1 hypothetical protein MTBBW1_2030040 [Desulfamplus magnetovallimortis]